jgi:hypothetical protein
MIQTLERTISADQLRKSMDLPENIGSQTVTVTIKYDDAVKAENKATVIDGIVVPPGINIEALKATWAIADQHREPREIRVERAKKRLAEIEEISSHMTAYDVAGNEQLFSEEAILKECVNGKFD